MMASDSRTSGLAVAAKVCLVVVVLAVCTVVCSQAAKPVFIRPGRQVNLRVLFNDTVKQSGSYSGKATKKFCFPKAVNKPRVNITHYSFKDLKGTAGNVTIKSVAKNNTQLCMHFESNQRNKGFLFLFTVWGSKR